MQKMFYQFKRTAIHNLYITSSKPFPKGNVVEGLVLPEKLMRLADISPYERILVTKQGGDEWTNRIYSFAIPGGGDKVEARGALAYLLKTGECYCIISGTYFDQDQYKAYCSGTLNIPLIDIRFVPVQDNRLNDFSTLKMILEYAGKSSPYTKLDKKVIDQRKQLWLPGLRWLKLNATA